jgi:hypothetical protein
MGQRSPNNARYQKYTKPEGKTRRSAASAKPKRDSGTATSSSSKTSGTKGASARSKYAVPMTPEYRKWRNVWWAALGASAASALGFLLLDYLARRQGLAVPVGAKTAVLVVCYVFLGIGMWVDWKKVRPAREAAIRGGSD